jgi:hypothetical protein
MAMDLNTIYYPTLVGECRIHLNDPETGPGSAVWTDADIKLALNMAYRRVCRKILRARPGYFIDTDYADSVVGDKYVQSPSSMLRVKQFGISHSGDDIRDGTDPSVTWYSPGTEEAIEKVLAGQSNAKLYRRYHRHILYAPVVETAGTRSITLTYEYLPGDISGYDAAGASEDDDNETIIPSIMEGVIPVDAAIILKSAAEMDLGFLPQLSVDEMRDVMILVGEDHLEPTRQTTQHSATDVNTYGRPGIRRIRAT